VIRADFQGAVILDATEAINYSMKPIDKFTKFCHPATVYIVAKATARCAVG